MTEKSNSNGNRRSRSLRDDSQKSKGKGNVVELVFGFEDQDVAGLAVEGGADGFEG
jgi:hypothetical protein